MESKTFHTVRTVLQNLIEKPQKEAKMIHLTKQYSFLIGYGHFNNNFKKKCGVKLIVWAQTSVNKDIN